MASATTEPAGTATTTVDATVYQQVQQFYAEQMQLLDSGQAQQWAHTFTSDGVFATAVDPTPARGREQIAEGAAAAIAQLAADKVVHRHWLGMLAIRPAEDGALHARAYALVIRTPLGGTPIIWRSCVCEDLLVCSGDGWLVRDRRVSRDDLT